MADQVRMSEKRQRRPISMFLLLSLLVHAGLGITLLVRHLKPVAPKRETVEIEYKTPDAPVQALTEADKKKTKGPKAQVPERQIVEQKDRINDELDEKTRFLSAFNQKVIHETKALRSGKFMNTAAGGHPDEGRKDGDKQSREMADEKANAKKATAKDSGELPSLKDLSPKFALTPGPKAPNSEKTGDPSQSDDYLKDVKGGMQTLLSTREFVYYAYYNRVKAAIRDHWEPTVREKVKIIYRQGRSIASAKDRVTQVIVTLDKDGALLNVQVIGQSGITSLDDAAVESFRAAAPFPNPPKGMVESDGTVKIRWDFVLEV